MSGMNEWEEERLIRLERRVESLERTIAGLDGRTAGLVRLGPSKPKVDHVALREAVRKAGEEAKPDPPPPDRSQRTLADGSPVTADHREINPTTGMQKDYVVLSAEERAKGFVRPVRRTYQHLKCGVVTTMSQAIAETYARDPGFYNGTFCVGCRGHFPVGEDGEFVWDGTDERVGT